MRVLKWLSDSRIASTSRHDGLEIEIGNHAASPVGTPLPLLQSAPELLEANEAVSNSCKNILEPAETLQIITAR